MQQVDRKRVMFIYFLTSLMSLFFIFGCAAKNEYTSSTRSFDKNITKDQLLHAVKRVFTITDKDAFIIDSYRNELNITKPKATHKLYTMDIQNDNFDFKVDDNRSKTTLDASISISRTYGIEEEKRYYVKEDSFTYQLFWDRVEFLLGKQEDWKICNYLLSEGFMCDVLDLDNTWADKKDMIDLTVTKKDGNSTKETIKLSTSYKKNISTDIQNKELQQDIYMIDNNKMATKASEDQKTKEKDATIKSYKLPITENLDTNSSVKMKKKVDYLKDQKIEEINLDTNSTHG